MPLHEHEYDDEQPAERRRPMVARYYDEQADRRAHTRPRVPASAAALPAYRGSRLVVDDDGGLTPAWVMAQRRSMSHHASDPLRDMQRAAALYRAPVDHMHFDVRPDPEQVRATLEAMGDSLRPMFEALNEVAKSVGGQMQRFIESLRLPGSPPPLALRDSDPRLYALELRRTRSTGPSRPNAQTARRPRKHQP